MGKRVSRIQRVQQTIRHCCVMLQKPRVMANVYHLPIRVARRRQDNIRVQILIHVQPRLEIANHLPYSIVNQTLRYVEVMLVHRLLLIVVMTETAIVHLEVHA